MVSWDFDGRSQVVQATSLIQSQIDHPWRPNEASEWRDEIGLPCAECGQITYPDNYECGCSSSWSGGA